MDNINISIEFMTSIVGKEAVKYLIYDTDGCAKGFIKRGPLNLTLEAYNEKAKQQGRGTIIFDLASDESPDNFVFICMGPPQK